MWKRFGSLVLAVALLLSIANPRDLTKKSPSSSTCAFKNPPVSQKKAPIQQRRLQDEPSSSSTPLEYDFYRDKCPQAESIVRSTLTQLFSFNFTVAPALLRLVFHDCFIQGCDASILLDRINDSPSERDAIPNQTLKGFDAIDTIKSELEEACPATVSCADILVLAARDGVVLAGGPFYPVLTGRRDSKQSFFNQSLHQIPAPDDDNTEILSNFATRGFTDRETVSLLGAHNIGTVHCSFFKNRLYNFSGTGSPDASLDLGLLEEMRSLCGKGSTEGGVDGEPGMEMGYREEERRRRGSFDNHYYSGLLDGRGLLHADQQLTAGRTVRLVRGYASEGDGAWAFRRDFARSMMKLSGLSPLSGSEGQVRLTCSQLLASS